MGKKLMLFGAVTCAVAAALAGCNNDPESNRSVIFVQELNNNSTFLCDVLEQGDSVDNAQGIAATRDDYIPEDRIQVKFYNKPYSQVVTTAPGTPHGDFIITRYRVEWSRTDGGATALPVYEGGLTLSIPSGEEIEGYFTLVTYENKSTAPLADLCYLCPSAGQEVSMNATGTFYGHELGTDREPAGEALRAVHFPDIFVECNPNP